MHVDFPIVPRRWLHSLTCLLVLLITEFKVWKCNQDEPGYRGITGGDVGWLFYEGADHGLPEQWFHAACLGIFTPRDYRHFKLCIGCTSKIERSSYSSRATSGDSCAEVPIVKCSPRCSGCKRVCDAGMVFLSQEQRKGLRELVVEDHFARLRVRFRPGDHVHVERERRADEGPSTREASKNVNINMNNNKNQSDI